MQEQAALKRVTERILRMSTASDFKEVNRNLFFVILSTKGQPNIVKTISADEKSITVR
jgi:hypothetical protein